MFISDRKTASLTPCPDSAPIVCPVRRTTNDDSEHFVKPISPSSFLAYDDPIATLSGNDHPMQDPAAKIIVESEHYLYAEYSSSIMRFVDDVEFLFLPEKQLIHVRSASRLGRS